MDIGHLFDKGKRLLRIPFSHFSRYAYLWVAVGGGVLALLLYFLVQRHAHTLLDSRFNDEAFRLERALQWRVEQVLGSIDALSGFFLATYVVAEKEYSLYVERILSGDPEMVALSWWQIDSSPEGESGNSLLFMAGDPAYTRMLGDEQRYRRAFDALIRQGVAQRGVVSVFLPAESGDGKSRMLAVAYPAIAEGEAAPLGVAIGVIQLDTLVELVLHREPAGKLQVVLEPALGAEASAAALAVAEGSGRRIYQGVLQWPGLTLGLTIRRDSAGELDILYELEAWLILLLGIALSASAATLLRGFSVRNRRLALRNEQLLRQREIIELAHREWMDAFDAIPNPIFLHDEKFRVMRANRAYAALAERPLDEISGHYYWELFPRGEGARPVCSQGVRDLKAVHEELLSGGRNYDCFYYPVTDERGRYRYSIHVMEDVTERRKTAHALVEEKSRAQRYLDVANVIILALDTDARITLINQRGCDLLGYTEGQLLGRDWFECCIDAAERDVVRQMFEDGVQSGALEEYFENPVLTAGGEKRFIAWHNTLLRDKNGKATGILSSGSDITEKRKLEEALRESAERFGRVMSATSDGVWDWDIRNSTVYFSPVWKAMLGYRDEEIANDMAEWRSRVHPDDLPAAEAAIARHLAGETEHLVVEHRMRHKDGHWLWVLSRGQVERDETGEPSRAIGTHIDITERREMENRLASLVSELEGRVKEQRCLFDISRLTADTERPLGEIFQAIVERIPSAFQHPEGVTVHLAYREQVYRAGDTTRTVISVVHDIRQHDEVVGNIATLHHEPDHEEEGVAFLPEEHHLLESVADRIESMLALRDNRNALQRVNHTLRTLSRSNRILVRAESESQLISDIGRVMIESSGYTAIWLAQVEGERLEPIAAVGPCDAFADNIVVRWQEDPAFRVRVQSVLADKEVNQLVLRESDMAHFCQELQQLGSLHSVLLPVATREEQPFGVMGVYSVDPQEFGTDEVELLQELAGDIAFGITSLRTLVERDRARQALDKVLFQTIEAIGLTVEKRDPYTAGHQQRVAQLAVAIGRAMGLEEERLVGLHLGAVIHDIGKVYVPSEILNRPGKLSEYEFGVIKSHPEVGYDIVKGVDFPWPVALMIRQHHERLDGSGYPDGLKGDAILMESKILAVADVMEAISSHRPYRAALGREHGLEVLRAGRDTLFDAAVVDTCLTLFEGGGFEWDRPDQA
jgi:PAS domain S-box-containing protein